MKLIYGGNDKMFRIFSSYTIVLVVALLNTFIKDSVAQPDYLMSAANVEKVNSSTYEFDVYIKSTGINFTLTSYQCVFSFNQTVINNGTLNFSFIPGTSELVNLPPAAAIGLLSSFGSYVLTFASMPEEEIISSVNKKVGRFRLTNSVPYTITTFNLRWRFTGLLATILTGTGFNDITNSDYHVNLSEPSTFPLTVPINNGWNMVSVPGLHPVNQNVTTWWINKDPGANVFKFDGGFREVTSVEPGVGYWMKNLGSTIYNTGDEWPASGILYVANQPLAAVAGWNLIGTYDYTISASGISTNPTGLQSGFIFQYLSGSGFTVTNTLVPGYGYLIKLNTAGFINLPDPAFHRPAKTVEYFKEDWGKIIITDKEGKSSTLFSVNGKVNLDKYQLPPLPHEGMFDIRYGSGRFAENLKDGFQSIELRGIEFPLTIKVEKTALKIQDESGKIVNFVIKAGEEIFINKVISRLIVSSDVVPAEYLLEQNYPNPFNPSTKIKFSVPVDGLVKIKVYDMLGREIRILFNESVSSGEYFTSWDGTDKNGNLLTSGFYIYRMEAGDFVQSRKMMLMK